MRNKHQRNVPSQIGIPLAGDLPSAQRAIPAMMEIFTHDEEIQVQNPSGTIEIPNAELTESSLEISDDATRLDRDLIYRFISEQSYWARDIPREIAERALDHSLCFGAYLSGQQVGFARMISDFATFAYLADVFVLPEYRGRGYSHRLMDAILRHPQLQNLRRMVLCTADAHGLYSQHGFSELAMPERYMERLQPGLYQRMKATRGEN